MGTVHRLGFLQPRCRGFIRFHHQMRPIEGASSMVDNDRGEQSRNLLLVSISRAILVFGPRWDPWAYICSFQHHFCVLEQGLLFNDRGGTDSSPVQFSKLLLVLARTVVLFSELFGANDLIYVRSKNVYVFGDGASISMRGGAGLPE
jgi:hypothetical protein